MDAKYILRLAATRSAQGAEHARAVLAKAEARFMQAKIDLEEARANAEKSAKSHEEFVKEVDDFKDWNSV